MGALTRIFPIEIRSLVRLFSLICDRLLIYLLKINYYRALTLITELPNSKLA